MEAEHRIKRGTLSLCQDHLRKVVDITRKANQLIDSFVKKDKKLVSRLNVEIENLGNEIDSGKRNIARELAERGAILISREDFLRFADLTSEISDFCKGIAFRLLEISNQEWRIPSRINTGLINLADAVFETILRLRDTLITVNYGSIEILEKAKSVEEAEKKVDRMYRQLEIDLIKTDMNIAPLILLKDVIELLEDTADKIEDASDAARILAFSM
jgi:predicted phosphate transport protein (TIGR00153 family)